MRTVVINPRKGPATYISVYAFAVAFVVLQSAYLVAHQIECRVSFGLAGFPNRANALTMNPGGETGPKELNMELWNEKTLLLLQ